MSFSIIKAAALCTTSIIPIDLFDLKALEAHADPVTSALVAIGFSATAAAFVVQVGLSLAFSTLSRLLAPKPSFESGGIQTDVTLSGSKTPQKIILGFYATNGCLAVAPLSRHGSNRKKMNYWLNYVTVISDLPINELLGVIVDGKEQTIIDADNNEFGRKVSGDLDGTARFRWYLGNQTTADDYLLESYGSHDQFPWTTQHILKGCAYVISSFYYDDERYTNLPSTRFIVKGASLYDPRKDSSVGGSGPQRWNDRSTWTFTANPIVMVYNLIRGITMPDGLVYGVRAPAEKLPLSSWFAAMNVCDEDGTQPNSTDWKADRKRYQAGIEISLDTEPLEVIEELLKAAGAELSEAGGYFYVRAGAPSAPVAHITDDVIIVSDPISERPFQGLNESFNTVRATYPDPKAVWESTEAEPFSKPEWVAADQGLELVADIKLSAVPFPRQVRRLMREAAADHRRRRVHTLTLPPSYLGLKPLDSISWTSPSRFYDAKVFEIQQIRINPMTLNVQIDIKERNPADYDIDAANDSIAPYYPPPPPVPQEEIGMDGLAVAGVVVKDAAGNDRMPGIKVSWDLADDGTSYDAVNYQVRLKSSGAVVVTGTTQATDVGSVIITESLLPNEIYQVRAKVHEPESGVRWRYSNWIDVTTPNVRISPIDLDDTIFDQMKETAIRHGVKPVTTIPATGETDQLVMHVPTGKLYRWNGSAWVSELVATPTPGSVDIASFALGIEPITPWAGAALPTTKKTSLIFWNGETYRWSGGAYVKNVNATDVIGELKAAQIAAGAIGTRELAAQAVVASKVAISDFSNLVSDADFSEFFSGGSTWISAGGQGPFQAFNVAGNAVWASPYILRLSVNGTGDTNYSGVQSSTFAVTGGTDYHVSALLQTQGSGGANVILRLAFYNNAGALLGQRNVYADTANLAVDRKTANVTAHANAAYARVQMYIRNDSVASYVQMGSLAVRKAAGGELIVDGSVKGNHISSNTLTSNHHTTGSLLAEHINTSSFNAAGLAVFNNVLQSNNYVANTSGWRIQQNGNAEFNSLKVRSDMIVSGAVSKTYYQQFQTFTKDDTSVWEGVIPLGSGLSFAAAEDDGGALLNPIRTEFYCSLGRRSSVSSCRIAVTLWASTAANPNAWINLYGTNSEFNSIYLASKELEGGEALAVNGLLIGGVYSSILFERIANLKVRVVMDTGKGVVYRPKVIVSQISR